MVARGRLLLFVIGLVAVVPVSAGLAFFLAGAVVFPIVEPYYATRVIASLGLMAFVYGGECLLNWGVIETCGFLSGNCSTHNLYPYALSLWLAIATAGFAGLLWLLLRHRRQNRDDRS
jgi:membrane-bound ClpP family serine protease